MFPDCHRIRFLRYRCALNVKNNKSKIAFTGKYFWDEYSNTFVKLKPCCVFTEVYETSISLHFPNAFWCKYGKSHIREHKEFIFLIKERNFLTKHHVVVDGLIKVVDKIYTVTYFFIKRYEQFYYLLSNFIIRIVKDRL